MGSAYGASYFIVLTVFALEFIAFGLAIGAETRRHHGVLKEDIGESVMYCEYKKDIATGLGVGAFLFLLLGQLVVMGLTKCLCCSTPLRPGGSRVATVVFFVLTWITFIIAEICLLAGSSKAAYRTRRQSTIGSGWDVDCETLRKGVFAAGAAFALFTMILSEGYYFSYVKAQEGSWQTSYNNNGAGGGPSVGMANYPRSF